MADARLRSEWLGQMRFDDLSDTAWRVFTSALMWSVGNGTDGLIPKRYLKYLHPEGPQHDAHTELVQAGLWSEQTEAYVLLDWSDSLGQSTAEQVEKYRADARERSRRRRERAKQRREAQEAGADDSGAQTPGVTPNVTRDVRTNVGKGTGKGTGNGGGGTGPTDHAPEATSWATAVPGQPGLVKEPQTEFEEIRPGEWVEKQRRRSA